MDMNQVAEKYGLHVPLINNQSAAYKQCAAASRLLLAGVVLAIDPSIGSMSSQPGYAVYRGGQLTDCGVLSGRTSGSHSSRLYEIGRMLREEFSDVQADVLVLEQVPVSRFGKSGRRSYSNPAAQVPLHRACGAILASVPARTCVEVAPQTWRRYAVEGAYIKGDVADAVALGFACIQMALHAEEQRARTPKKRPVKKPLVQPTKQPGA